MFVPFMFLAWNNFKGIATFTPNLDNTYFVFVTCPNSHYLHKKILKKKKCRYLFLDAVFTIDKPVCTV